MSIREIPLPAGESRIETGPLRVGDDWAGLFIRGDNAFGYAMMILPILEQLDKNPENIEDALAAAGLRGLLQDLQSCNEHTNPATSPPQADGGESNND